MRNRGFSSACKGAYLAYVTAARAQKSTIYRAKPTPKPSKAQSPSQATPPLKLLHLASDTFKGGAESVFRNTIEATLESKQFDIYVASCDEAPPCGIAHTHFLRLDDWQLYPKWRGAYKYIFNPTNYKRLKAFLFTIKPDIIHTQNYLSRLSPSVLFALKSYKTKHPNARLIYTQHGFGPCANGGLYNYAKGQICEQCIGHSKGLRIAYQNCDRRGRIHSILKALRSPFYQGALLQEKELFDTIICVGEFQRSKHIQDGWDSSKLITLTNPIETHFYNPHASLQEKQDLLVFFGRLAPEKNVPLLLHAFANLLKLPRFSHYKLLIIGDGDDKPKCLELARELISPNVKNLESSNGDSALRDKSAILRGGLAHYRLDKSLRPPLENANFSSQILESQSGVGDCALGNHSPDCLHFRAVITDKVTPTLKCKQNKQSNTAILRILEEEKQPQSKNQTELDSSVDCHADKSARNDEKNSLCEKVDSRSEAQNVSKSAQNSSEAPFLSLRENPQGFSWQSISAQADSKQNAKNLTTPQAAEKVDSRNDYSASAECMDCHADKSARNDDKAQNVSNSAQDSRSFDKEAQNVFCSQVDRRQDFCDKNGALQGESKARTWACVTADSPQQSPFLAKTSEAVQGEAEAGFFSKKPTPKQQPKDSRSFTQNAQNLSKPQAEAVEMRNRCFQAVGAGFYLSGNEQAHRAEIKGLSRKAQSSSQSPSDSKILELESGLFKARKEDKTRGLSTQRADEIHDSSPKAESPLSPLPCTFLPAHPPHELAAILAKAKLTILPSLWYETFGLTIVESILAGAIPIASDLGAMQETIASFYGKSFSFDPRQALLTSNIHSLEVCIINTLDSYESEFATLLQKREEIMQNLHSKHYLKKLINLYLYGGGGHNNY